MRFHPFIVAILAAAVTAAAAQEAPIVVGAVVSQSGSQAPLAAGYRKALLLWQDQVNASGGLLGRKLELRLLDDHSEAASAGNAYAELIRDGASLLIGPYGSAATLAAAAEADRARRVMVNGAGPSGRVYKRAQRYVFQALAPYSSYGEGVLELSKDAGCASLLVLARNDIASEEMGEATRERALKLGFRAAQLEVYSGSDIDFAPLVAKAKAAKIDGWIAFGGARDSADMVIAMKRAAYAPRLFYASGAADARFIAMVGQDAEFTLASEAHDARFPTPGNDVFVKAYAAKWSAKPDAGAAEGYAAATVLARAVERAGALDQEKLRGVLAALETGTVLGPYKVAASGEQVGIKPAVIQILAGRARFVWPPAWRGDRQVQPYPQWNERKILR
jgi:branched-chain amino acid transport system substrate-binding protein